MYMCVVERREVGLD